MKVAQVGGRSRARVMRAEKVDMTKILLVDDSKFLRMATERDWTDLAARDWGVSGEARVDGNRELVRKLLHIRAHCIAFRPFSARTWLRSERS